MLRTFLLSAATSLLFAAQAFAGELVIRVTTPDGKQIDLGTIEGHQEQFKNKQRSLKASLQKWNDDDCNSKTGNKVPRNVYDWASASIPTPISKPAPQIDSNSRLPVWVQEMGGVISDGGLILKKSAEMLGTAIVTVLVILASLFGLDLRLG